MENNIFDLIFFPHIRFLYIIFLGLEPKILKQIKKLNTKRKKSTIIRNWFLSNHLFDYN